MAGRTKLLLQAAAVALVASLVFLLAWQLATKDAGAGLVKAVKRGETPPAPALTLPRLDGTGTVSLASLRGKAVVVNFWASWCEPCKQEAPLLQQAWEDRRDEGLVVLGVDAQDIGDDARAFARRYGITYPVVHDGPGSSLGHWGTTGFPETWWVDRHGRLVGYKEGQVTQEDLDRYNDRALGTR
jgi:cytochrome c biogenesis protein CcmG, thiol:disulfide interchange protein DsbE